MKKSQQVKGRPTLSEETLERIRKMALLPVEIAEILGLSIVQVAAILGRDHSHVYRMFSNPKPRPYPDAQEKLTQMAFVIFAFRLAYMPGEENVFSRRFKDGLEEWLSFSPAGFRSQSLFEAIVEENLDKVCAFASEDLVSEIVRDGSRNKSLETYIEVARILKLRGFSVEEAAQFLHDNCYIKRGYHRLACRAYQE